MTDDDDIYEVSTEWEVLEGGYAIPRRFPAIAYVHDETPHVHDEMPPDTVTVVAGVDVQDGRARVRAVLVSSDRPLGVGSGTLRGIPVREAVAWRARYYLHRIEFDEHGEPTKVPVAPDDEKATAVIQQLVGYMGPTTLTKPTRLTFPREGTS